MVNLFAANRDPIEILPRRSMLFGCKQSVLSFVNAFVSTLFPPVMLHTLLFQHASFLLVRLTCLILCPSQCLLPCDVPRAMSLTPCPSCHAPHSMSLMPCPSCYVPHAMSLTLCPSRYVPHATSLTLCPSCCVPHNACCHSVLVCVPSAIHVYFEQPLVYTFFLPCQSNKLGVYAVGLHD